MKKSPEAWQMEVHRDRLIDSVCDEFERDLQAGGQLSLPRIEAQLPKVEESLRHRLLLELIPIDLHYRRRVGEAISPEEYRRRFADLTTEECSRLFPAHGPPRPSADSLVELAKGARSIDELAGTRFGDYEILRRINCSSQAVIYQARQLSLNRAVALKFILANTSVRPHDVESFFRVARRASLLHHRYIVPIFEVGQQAGYYFYSMGYMDGTSLADTLVDAPVDGLSAIRSLIPVCQAVQYAHENGLVHCDLKPTNILIDQQGTPRVTDFGLTRHLHPDSDSLRLSDYLSPEQVLQDPPTPGLKSDVYALGAILYRMTTGRPPCQASDLQAYRRAIEQITLPRRLNPSITKDLEFIMLKCLDPKPSGRFNSVWELQENLERVLSGRSVHTLRAPPLKRLWHFCRGLIQRP